MSEINYPASQPRKFKVGDKVKTVENPFSKKQVRYGTVVFVHPSEKYAPYIVDFGDTWGGFFEQQTGAKINFTVTTVHDPLADLIEES